MRTDHDLRAALRGRFAAAPRLRDAVLRDVLENVPETTQLSVVPTHQTRGRFWSMSSVMKLAAAGVLGTAFGVFLLADVVPTGPSQDPRPAAEAAPSESTDAAPGDAMATAWVTGNIRWAASCSPATFSEHDGVIQERGHSCEPRTVSSDDPRLAGTSVGAWNKDVHTTGANRRSSVLSLTEDIRGESGGWLCHAAVSLDEGASFFVNPVQGSNLYTCTGDGDNAGLMAVLAVNPETGRDEFEGLIFPGDMPPAPDMSAEG